MPVVDCLKLKFLAIKQIKMENTSKEVDIASDIAIVFFEFF